MDDDEKDGVKRADRSKKPMNDVLQRVARPAWRSPLFFWLVEHHDTLRRNEAETGRGVPWRELCVEFVELGITLADGRPVKPATAKRNWHRVRRELARVEERRAARERAERERRFATDPRRNMPSRFPKGDYGPPLSDRLPQRAPWPHARPTSASPPKAGTGGIADGGAEGRGLAVMPGGPVLTGGFEEEPSGRGIHGRVRRATARSEAVHSTRGRPVLGVAGGGRGRLGARPQAGIVDAF